MTWQQTLQRSLKVAADGIIGPNTYRALFGWYGAKADRADELALAANAFLGPAGICDNSARFAMFFAQCAHETAGFYYMEEIASGAAYEGRKDLGNTQACDGRRFKGRGVIQLTGRANYTRFARAHGIDVVRHPEIVALPSLGLMAAVWYWRENNINALCDTGSIEAVTRRINGGLTGLADRKARLAKITGLLA